MYGSAEWRRVPGPNPRAKASVLIAAVPKRSCNQGCCGSLVFETGTGETTPSPGEPLDFARERTPAEGSVSWCMGGVCGTRASTMTPRKRPLVDI